MGRPSKQAGKASELLAGVRGKPEPVVIGGYKLYLRSLTVGQLLAFQQWHADHKEEPSAGLTLSRKLVAASVIDPDSGEPILTEEDVDGLDAATLNRIA